MVTTHIKNMHRIILDIKQHTEILERLISDRFEPQDAIAISSSIDLGDCVFKTLDALLCSIATKDMSVYKTRSQSAIDKMMFDINKPTVSYQTVYDILSSLESYVLRTLVNTLPEIDSEGTIVDSLQRLNEDTVSINLLR